MAILLAQASPGAAHPHIFIDADGRLTELDVTWIYDAMTSLLMLEDLRIDAAAPLAPEDRARLAAYQTEWQPGFDGDSYLIDGDRRIAVSGPLRPDATIEDAKVVITFARNVETPFRPGPETVVEIYDPTYFTAYAVTAPPRLAGAATGCTAEVEHFRPTASLQPLLDQLGAIPADQDPAEDLGRLFAERVHLACD